MNEMYPTDSHLSRIEVLIDYLLMNFTGITHLIGHRDFSIGESECPGKQLYQLLPELANTYELDLELDEIPVHLG
jgi:hypothetical protein